MADMKQRGGEIAIDDWIEWGWGNENDTPKPWAKVELILAYGGQEIERIPFMVATGGKDANGQVEKRYKPESVAALVAVLAKDKGLTADHDRQFVKITGTSFDSYSITQLDPRYNSKPKLLLNSFAGLHENLQAQLVKVPS